MNIQILFVIGFALIATGCAEKEQAAPEQVDETPMSAPADEAPVAQEETRRNDAFLEHMHLHAEKLDDLNFALADDDLEAARKPAYWLSRHETVSDTQPEWQPFLDGMRAEAHAIEVAPDLETARAASERITGQCQGCHVAAGINRQQQ